MGRSGDWPTWQGSITRSRYNPAERQITAANVGGLRLKWAFAYRKTGLPARSQPAVVGDTVYVGSPDGAFSALDARTGRTRWSYTLPPSPTAAPAVVSDSPAVADGKVFFGDFAGRVYALQRTGALIWSVRAETNPTAYHTSSPLYYRGRIYLGASSVENTLGADYACCTFRGHLDAIDADTGALAWRYYTVPEPRAVGHWPSGAIKYEPSGGGVWSTPVVDPATGTIYVGTGQNYTGNAGDFDSLLALSARTGAVRWKQKMNRADTWRALCNDPNPAGYCPGLHDGTALDYDLGSMPTLFWAGGRRLVGIGQKSGVFHVFDARTGQVRWRRQLSTPFPSGGISGLQWGGSYDGRRLYLATWYANPGTLFALDPATGDVLWQTPNPADGCTTGGAASAPDVWARWPTPRRSAAARAWCTRAATTARCGPTRRPPARCCGPTTRSATSPG